MRGVPRTARPLPLDMPPGKCGTVMPSEGGLQENRDRHGHGSDMEPHGQGGLRFFLVEDEPARLEDGPWPALCRGSVSRLAAARTALREAQQAECEERSRGSGARVEGLTAPQAALLQARQAQTQAALAAVEDLSRRAAWLRQAIALGEEAVARQRQIIEKLRRELTEIGH